MTPFPKIPPETKEDAYFLFCQRLEPVKIAEILEINFNTLRQWIMKGKWTERRKKNEELMEQIKPTDKRPIVVAMARTRAEAKKIYEEKSGTIAAEDIEHWTEKMNPEERLAAAPGIAALNGVHRKNLGLDEEAQTERGHISLTFLTKANEPGFVRLLDESKVKQIENAEPPDEQ